MTCLADARAAFAPRARLLAVAFAATTALTTAQDALDTPAARCDWFGVALASAGDIDGDGRDDLLIAEANRSSSEEGHSRARVVSACDGRLITDIALDDRASVMDLRATCDVDADGAPDVLALTRPLFGGTRVELQLWSSKTGQALARRVLLQDRGVAHSTFALCADIDVDADGVNELFVVGAWGASKRTRSNTLWCLNVKDLTSRFEFMIPEEQAPGRAIGSLLAVSDLSGDGRPDLVMVTRGFHEAGAERAPRGESGRIHARSSVTGEWITAWPAHDLPWDAGALLNAPDSDGDGTRELASLRVSVSASARVATLVLRSGRTGALLREVALPFAPLMTEPRLIGLGDVTCDGTPELLLTTPGRSCGSPAAFVLDGATSTQLHALADEREPPFPFGTYLGNSLTALGDVDLDGVPDFAVGGVNYWGLDEGAVQVHSGKSGALLRRITRRDLSQ